MPTSSNAPIPANSRPLILIADDETRIRRLVAEHFEAAGFDVCQAQDGKDAVEVFTRTVPKPDLVILDLMMPEMDGHEALAKLRTMSAVPVIILTARDMFEDKKRSFMTGADDYLTKPFSLPELELRVLALMRRAKVAQESAQVAAGRTDAALGRGEAPSSAATHASPAVTVNGELVLDPSRLEVLWRGSAVRLSDREFKLLNLLASRPGWIVRYEELLRAGWPNDLDADTAHLRVAAARIRKKLAGLGLNPRVLSSYTNVGYMIGDLSDYDEDYAD